MKMTKKDQKAIASVFNSIQCSTLMRLSARNEENWEMVRHWLNDEELSTCVLGVHFGIKLPNFDRMLADMILAKGENQAYDAIKLEYDLTMALK